MTGPDHKHSALAALKARSPRARAAFAAGVLLAALVLPPPTADAEMPGRVYCHHGICYRVRAIDEVSGRIGEVRGETASYYDAHSSLRRSIARTSSGEPFSGENRHRVSSSIYPDGTELLLRNPRNGRTAHVRVNAIGPFHGRRTLDLTHGLAVDLDFQAEGVTPLDVFIIAAPNAAEARHDRTRVYPPTLGYLGMLDEDNVRALADALIGIAMGKPESVREVPVRDTAAISMPAAAAAAVQPIGNTVPAAAAEHRPAPIRVAAAATPPPPIAKPLVSAANHTSAVAEPGPTLISPWASGASRNFLLLALALTLATLLLARIRRPDHIIAGTRPPETTAARTTAAAPEATLTVAFRRLACDADEPPAPANAATDDVDRNGMQRHARYLIDAGEFRRAETELRRLLEMSEATLGPSHCRLAEPLQLWADCVRDAGRPDDALQIYARALALAETACPSTSEAVPAILEERARLYIATAQLDAAADDARRAAQAQRQNGRPRRAIAPLLLLAEAQHGDGLSDAAEATLREALHLATPDDHLGACEAAVGLAHLLAARGAVQEAQALVTTAHAALDVHLGLAAGKPTACTLDPIDDYRAIDVAVHVRRRAVELAIELSGKRSKMPLVTLI